MSTGHLYVLLGKVSIQVLCPFFNLVVFVVDVGFVSTLHILGINPLSDLLANMFSHFMGSLFILLMISFAVQNLFNLL